MYCIYCLLFLYTVVYCIDVPAAAVATPEINVTVELVDSRNIDWYVRRHFSTLMLRDNFYYSTSSVYRDESLDVEGINSSIQKSKYGNLASMITLITHIERVFFYVLYGGNVNMKYRDMSIYYQLSPEDILQMVELLENMGYSYVSCPNIQHIQQVFYDYLLAAIKATMTIIFNDDLSVKAINKLLEYFDINRMHNLWADYEKNIATDITDTTRSQPLTCDPDNNNNNNNGGDDGDGDGDNVTTANDNNYDIPIDFHTFPQPLNFEINFHENINYTETECKNSPIADRSDGSRVFGSTSFNFNIQHTLENSDNNDIYDYYVAIAFGSNHNVNAPYFYAFYTPWGYIGFNLLATDTNDFASNSQDATTTTAATTRAPTGSDDDDAIVSESATSFNDDLPFDDIEPLKKLRIIYATILSPSVLSIDTTGNDSATMKNCYNDTVCTIDYISIEFNRLYYVRSVYDDIEKTLTGYFIDGPNRNIIKIGQFKFKSSTLISLASIIQSPVFGRGAIEPTNTLATIQSCCDLPLTDVFIVSPFGRSITRTNDTIISVYQENINCKNSYADFFVKPIATITMNMLSYRDDQQQQQQNSIYITNGLYIHNGWK